MPNLDDHMDELFQKAAKNYPLKASPGNFDDLIPFFAGKTASTIAPVGTKGKRKTLLLLLVFLITAGTTGTFLITTKDKGNSNSSQIDQIEKPSSEQVIAQGILQRVPKNEIIPPGNTGVPFFNNKTATETKTPAENPFQKNKTGAFIKAKFLAKITSTAAVADDADIENDSNNDKAQASTKTDVAVKNPQPVNAVEAGSAFKPDIIEKLHPKSTVLTEETKTSAKSDKKKKSKPSFYIGLTAGTELNQVKNQGISKVGFNAGILVGLQINQKLSAEAGVQLSQKKYYTLGKYFRPKSGSMPANMTVMSLNGNSTLVEIPVSAKYNFSKKQNTFYGKAGISTYILAKEANKYQVIVSGQQQEINSTYKNAKTYAAAEARISAGYQHPVGKKLNIRVEPYIQIPLKGIGIGALPVTSTGLQLVLTSN